MALLKVLLLLLGLGVSVKSAVSLQKRIIGGQNCDNTERLFYVRLESSNVTHKIRCGGSLIHPQWILSAAHCWKPGWTVAAVLKVHPRTAVQQRLAIRQAPEIYVLFGRQHDIMMLKLETPVTDVPLVRLPNCNNRIKVGNVVQLAGEGGTTTGPNNQRLPPDGPIPAHLQCVNMKVHQVLDVLPAHGHLFSAGAKNKDICYGDSGGAAMHNGMIYGVIAFCGEAVCQSPVSIMDVCEYLGWIQHKLL